MSYIGYVPAAKPLTSADITDGIITNADIATTAAIATSKLGAGAVLQVVSATKTDTASVASSTFADITGLSVSITPSSASNKILVLAYINLAWVNITTKAGARIMRDSTAIAIGDSAGSRTRVSGVIYLGTDSFAPLCISVNHLDSPSSTSALTYKCQFNSMDNTGTVYVNRGATDNDASNVGRTVSGITVMEIKG